MYSQRNDFGVTYCGLPFWPAYAKAQSRQENPIQLAWDGFLGAFATPNELTLETMISWGVLQRCCLQGDKLETHLQGLPAESCLLPGALTHGCFG